MNGHLDQVSLHQNERMALCVLGRVPNYGPEVRQGQELRKPLQEESIYDLRVVLNSGTRRTC